MTPCNTPATEPTAQRTRRSRHSRTGLGREVGDAVGQEPPAGDPLGDAGPVQVRRDRRPGGTASRRRGSCTGRCPALGDDALVEHQPDLLASAASARSRTCSAVERRVALREQRRDLGVDAGRAVVPGVDAGLPGRDEPRAGSRETSNRSGNASCSVSATCSATAGPTSCSSTNGGIGRPERLERAVGDLERRALVDGRGDLAQEAGEQPVDDERRARP